jgi:hypothetical protein
MRALLLTACLPLGAQTYDVRFEVPFPQGQNLPNALLTGTGQRAAGSLDTGRGGILSLERTFLEWPVLRLSGGVETTRFVLDGQVEEGSAHHPAHLTQSGFGAGLQAQFWIPFAGVAGELGLVQRFQRYRFEAAGTVSSHSLSRTWLRVGGRWRLPLRTLRPYLSASYQEPLSKEHPVRTIHSVDLAAYLGAQGSGLEVQRLWSLGVGATF